MNRSNIIADLRQSTPQLTIGTLTTDDQEAAIQTLVEGGIRLLHIDVMDGKIWPKETVGPDFVAGLETTLIKDVHLLVDQPEDHIKPHAQAGAGLITFSVEYTDNIPTCLTLIEASGDHILRGVSLNPGTSLETIRPHLDKIDVVFLLAIGPDTGKQTYFDTIPAAVEQLRTWKPDLLITIDGAIKKDNVGKVAAMKPDFIATGSAIFDGVDPAGNIQEMQQSIASTS